MTAYIIRRLLFMVPTMFGIMLVAFAVVQFAPGGPVEQVIAKLSGSDTGATSRISGSPSSRSPVQRGARPRISRLASPRRPKCAKPVTGSMATARSRITPNLAGSTPTTWPRRYVQ